MTPTTVPLGEYFEPTRTSDRTAKIWSVAAVSSTEPATLLKFDLAPRVEAPIPSGYRTLDAFVAGLEQDPEWHEDLKRARSWVADTVLTREPLTLRKLRLQKGMSQAQLAESIDTQQPYIARIESGNADIRLDTCRRLARALGVDLNTLDLALQKKGAA